MARPRRRIGNDGQTVSNGEGEEIRSQNDDSLRPLARALLALSEQLSREEGP
jgi:hypothetical protein